jgi:hypothetical protein
MIQRARSTFFQGLFEREEYGEEEDGTPRFNYSDAYETWRVRLTNTGTMMLRNVGVTVTAIPPTPVSMVPARHVEAALPIALPSLSLRAGETQYIDVLTHHNGTPSVAFVGTTTPAFYPSANGTVIELRTFAEESVPSVAGRLEVRHAVNQVTVAGVPQDAAQQKLLKWLRRSR